MESSIIYYIIYPILNLITLKEEVFELWKLQSLASSSHPYLADLEEEMFSNDGNSNF